MLQLQKAEVSDIPAIQEIAHQTWPETFKNILSEKQIRYMLEMMYSTSSLIQQIQEKQFVFLLAKEKGDNLGFIGFELNHGGNSKTKIHKIYILPSAQGKGVGRTLLEAVKETALQHQNTSLLLNVNKYNLPAIRFYTKMGFKEIAKEDIDIGNGYWMEDVVMEARFTQNTSGFLKKSQLNNDK